MLHSAAKTGLSMNRFRALAAGSLLSAAVAVSGPVQAMQIQMFDTMGPRDRQDFTNLLIESAENVLIQAGRPTDAAKVHELFPDMRPGAARSAGEAEFEMNLDNARKAGGQKVEDALAATLKKNGIDLPGSFFTIASKFLPPIAPAPAAIPAPAAASRPAPSDDDDPIGPGGFITPPDR
jgi:hypothetical protein